MGCSHSLQHCKLQPQAHLPCSQAVLDIVAKLAGFASHSDIKGSEVTALTYAADLCYQLTLTRTFRAAEWVSAVSPFLAPYIGETEAHAVAEGSRTRYVTFFTFLVVVVCVAPVWAHASMRVACSMCWGHDKPLSTCLPHALAHPLACARDGRGSLEPIQHTGQFTTCRCSCTDCYPSNLTLMLAGSS